MSPAVMSASPANHPPRQKVLGYPVDLVDEASALALVEKAWANQTSLHVVTLNAEMVIGAQRDEKLDCIIKEADLIIPDGAGVVWALRLAGKKVERIPGIDLADKALE